MNNNSILSRKYIVISLIIHLAIFLLMAYFIHRNRISKTFVVFGAHSQKPSQAIMKLGKRRLIPFLGGGGSNGKGTQVNGARGNGKKNGATKKTTTKPRRSKVRGPGGPHVLNKRVEKKSLTKKPKTQAKASVPTIVKKEAPVLEKPTKQVTLRSGMNVQKKKTKKQLRAEKAKKAKEREARKKEDARKARKMREQRLQQERLAKQEEEKRLLEQARIEQARLEEARQEQIAQDRIKQAKDNKKRKLTKQKEQLLAKRDEPVTQKADITQERSTESSHDFDEDVGAGAIGGGEGDNLAAENPQDVMSFNLLAESDQELRVYQRSIQQEVGRLWHPPVGVPKGTTCRVMFSVARDGGIDQFEFVSRSKMLIYDLSILRVAKLFKFDQCLWGKRFTIDFCQ